MTKTATVYRLVTPEHICPYGLKAVDLLRREGYDIDDRQLTSQAAGDEFLASHHVETTPQTYIDGERVGGLDDLRRMLGKHVNEPGTVSYRPVLSLFAITLLMAIAAARVADDQWISRRTFEWFVAFTMCGLGYLKVRDVDSFSLMFLNYDLLARRWVPYSYIYPYAETGAGLLMISGELNWVSVPVALVIGSIGAVSVIKAVYIDKRELKMRLRRREQ